MIVRAILGLVALVATAAGAQTAASPPEPAPDYRQDSAWLCLPGRADACGRPLAVAALIRTGYGPVEQIVPAKAPPVDCFYVYPTVSRDPGLNSDLAPGIEETGTATVQFARFAGVCRTFAPLYRQVTLAALRRMLIGEDVDSAFDLAFADVRAAWHDYLDHRATGRPFVLIGHSQGSILLRRLIAEEIDGKPIARRLVSALLLGTQVEVPEGRLVGGSFKAIPLCSRGDQAGCVVTYMSFRAASPPPPGAHLGRAGSPGMTAACTNPAELAGDGTHLASVWFANAPVRPGETAVAWSSVGPPPAPFLATDDLVSAACVHDGQAGYLALSVNADPADARTDRIPGDVYLLGEVSRSWGTHLIDVNVAQGTLVGLVGRQAAAWSGKP